MQILSKFADMVPWIVSLALMCYLVLNAQKEREKLLNRAMAKNLSEYIEVAPPPQQPEPRPVPTTRADRRNNFAADKILEDTPPGLQDEMEGNLNDAMAMGEDISHSDIDDFLEVADEGVDGG